jgi:MFS transporter, ACS family, glucarate transporter
MGKRTNVRWAGLCLVFIICFISNLDRSNISVSTSTILKELNITPVQMGLITSFFSLAYAGLQIPSSLLVRRYGTRISVAVAVAFWSFFTLLTGFAGGFASLLLTRVFFGFSEAPVYPAMNKFNVHWFPVKERAFANAFPNGGSWFALIITPPLTVWILQTLNWHWVFILSSVLGFIGAYMWFVVTRNTPVEHPRINAAEKEYILSESEPDQTTSGTKVPWKQLFASRSFWGIGITYFSSVYLLQYFVYWLPFYLQNQLHMSLSAMGFAASVPWIFIFISTLTVGSISDRLVKKNHSLFVARNVLVLIGFTASAISMYLSTLTTNPITVVLLLSIALGFIGFNMTIPWAIASDIGGINTGIISSWMNTWGQVGAAIMATASAYVGTHFGWNYTLITLVCVAVMGIFATFLINPEKRIGGENRMNVRGSKVSTAKL